MSEMRGLNEKDNVNPPTTYAADPVGEPPPLDREAVDLQAGVRDADLDNAGDKPLDDDEMGIEDERLLTGDKPQEVDLAQPDLALDTPDRMGRPF